jgi:hypothetical protein
VFDGMLEKMQHSVVTTILIKCLIWQKGELEKAIDLLLEMNQKGKHMITMHYGLKVSAC